VSRLDSLCRHRPSPGAVILPPDTVSMSLPGDGLGRGVAKGKISPVEES
jgi:hypothetical protein